jgi:hypothetical protein
MYCNALIENISDINRSPILLNSDKHTYRYANRMNAKYMFVIAVIAATLVGTTITTADSALAAKYHKNQAVAQTNECGNGELPFNVLCSNVESQVQGDENAVALDSFQQGGSLQGGVIGPGPET